MQKNRLMGFLLANKLAVIVIMSLTMFHINYSHLLYCLLVLEYAFLFFVIAFHSLMLLADDFDLHILLLVLILFLNSLQSFNLSNCFMTLQINVVVLSHHWRQSTLIQIFLKYHLNQYFCKLISFCQKL